MHFAYAAKDASGDLLSGSIQAATAAEARRLLRSRGSFVTSLQADSASQQRTSATAPSLRGTAPARMSWSRGVSGADLMMVTSQLSVMTRSGLDFADALQAVARQCRSTRLAAVLRMVHDDVSAGQSVSSAMARHPDAFPSAYVAGIAAGEASGTLPTVLTRLAQLQRNQLRIRNAVRSTMIYPVILAGVAGVVIVALVLVVLPQFAQVFRDMGTPAPPLTALLLNISEWIRGHLLWTVAGGGLAAVAGWRLAVSPVARTWADHFLVTAPFIRNAMRNLLCGRVFVLLGSMLATGVPLLDALRLCGQSMSNRAFRDLFSHLEEEVTNGRGVGSAMAASPLLPPGAAAMVQTAERTGQLAFVLESAGEFFEEEGERAVKQSVKLLEPAVIVVMGCIVSVVVLAVMLPLLDVSTMSS